MSAAAANLDNSALFCVLTVLAAVFTVGFWSTITRRMSTFTGFVSHWNTLPYAVRLLHPFHSDARTVVLEGQGTVQKLKELL